LTEFLPLRWVIETLTIWHYLAWAAFFGLSFWRGPADKEAMPINLRLWAGIIMLPIFYAMTSLVVGQLFGDNFSWSQVWPSGLMLGGLVSSFFLVGFAEAIWHGDGRRLELFAFGGFAIPFAAGFFGLFFSVAWWLLPRAVGFGLIDFPKFPWGVQL
jgi:hypothetical protein